MLNPNSNQELWSDLIDDMEESKQEKRWGDIVDDEIYYSTKDLKHITYIEPSVEIHMKADEYYMEKILNVSHVLPIIAFIIECTDENKNKLDISLINKKYITQPEKVKKIVSFCRMTRGNKFIANYQRTQINQIIAFYFVLSCTKDYKIDESLYKQKYIEDPELAKHAISICKKMRIDNKFIKEELSEQIDTILMFDFIISCIKKGSELLDKTLIMFIIFYKLLKTI